MENSIYSPPQADLSGQASTSAPDWILKKIRRGWIAALIQVLLSVLMMRVAVRFDNSETDMNWWFYVSPVLVIVLAFGVYQKSRIAATLVFVYYAVSEILVAVSIYRLVSEHDFPFVAGTAMALIFPLVFLYFYFQAMVGTFQYHQFIKKSAQLPST